MSTAPPRDRAALGRAKLAARARRVARIRRRVAAATLAAFALAWGVIVFDGPMGNATLASTSTSSDTTTTSASTATTSSPKASSSDASGSSSGASSGTSGSSSSTPSAVTTSQS